MLKSGQSRSISVLSELVLVSSAPAILPSTCQFPTIHVDDLQSTSVLSRLDTSYVRTLGLSHNCDRFSALELFVTHFGGRCVLAFASHWCGHAPGQRNEAVRVCCAW